MISVYLSCKNGSTICSEFAYYVPHILNRTSIPYFSSIFEAYRICTITKKFVPCQFTVLLSKNRASRTAILAFNQHLNCKILHGGLFCSHEETDSDCDCDLLKILLQVQMIFPNSSEDHNKKGLHCNLVLYSAGFWVLLIQTATFLSNHLTLTFSGER